MSVLFRIKFKNDEALYDFTESAFEGLVGLARIGEAIIQGAVEGRPLSFNLLENYFSYANGLLDDCDCAGVLIGGFLKDLSDAEVHQLDPSGKRGKP